MPKKMVGENSKAVAAKARKAEKADNEKATKQKALDDAYWADDDKNLAKKQGKKEDAEKKRLEALAKKKERQDLAEQEEKEIQKKIAKAKANPVKVTQAQIREETERREKAARGGKAAPEPETHLTKPLPENINRVAVEGAEARNVEEAIAVLSIKDEDNVDKHPEKRMKAAYEEYANTRLPELKQENPGMRLSQLKQMMFKEWQKHPDNPLIKRLLAQMEEQ